MLLRHVAVLSTCLLQFLLHRQQGAAQLLHRMHA
jgi:hypothetical protein